jgi:hypothetical protein
MNKATLILFTFFAIAFGGAAKSIASVSGFRSASRVASKTDTSAADPEDAPTFTCDDLKDLKDKVLKELDGAAAIAAKTKFHEQLKVSILLKNFLSHLSASKACNKEILCINYFCLIDQ